MSIKHESMIGIMKLYDLRREPVLREAREWFDGFYADSFDDIIELFKSEDERYLRMTVTYWDMAASFVNHGAIDEEMFAEINTEHIAVFAKVEPFLEQLREMTRTPNGLAHLEKLVSRTPNAKEATADIRRRAKEKQAAQKQAAAA